MMRRFPTGLVGMILALSAATYTPTSSAGTVKLWGTADGDSIYIEEFSDGFYRMDLYDPPPRQTQQRFHSIQDPSVTYGSLTYDGFPNDENFRLGSVTYDDSALVGGSGLAPITALSVNVGYDPDDHSYLNYYRWTEYDTAVDSLSGTVTVVNGQATAINMTSEVRLLVTIFAGTVIEAPGTFSITGDRFDGYMEYLFNGTDSFIWDFAGTLSTLVAAQPGDFDGDGDIDGRDFLSWQRGESPNHMGGGDLADWQANYGVGPLSTARVPEPSSMMIVASFFLTGLVLVAVNRKGYASQNLRS